MCRPKSRSEPPAGRRQSADGQQDCPPGRRLAGWKVGARHPADRTVTGSPDGRMTNQSPPFRSMPWPLSSPG